MSFSKLILILIGVTLFAYISSLSNPFIWDDEQFITQNIYVQHFDVGKIFTTNTVAGAGVVSNYYRPLTTLTFAINAKLWGSNPFGFHLTNLFFHIGAGVLLFLLLLELFLIEKAEGNAALYPPFFISLFFLIHPIQTEAVVYMNSLGDSMYTCFLFASLWVFTLLLEKNTTQTNAPLSQKGLVHSLGKDQLGISSVGFFILSLLSKETALAGVGLYIVIAVYCYLYEGKGNRSLIFTKNKNAFISLGAIVLSVVVYLCLRLTVLNFGNTLNFYGSLQNAYTQSLAVRLFTFAKVLWVYIGLLVWPYPLHMERSVSFVTSIASPFVWGTLLAIGGVCLLGILEYKKKETIWILFGLVWMLGMLVPESGIIPINGLLYEHWLYVPMIGFFIMLYGIGKFIISNFQSSIKSQDVTSKMLNTLQKGVIALLFFVTAVCVILTIRQNNIWADPVTFYSYTLQFVPDSARLHNNLGLSLADRGDTKGAIAEYRKALSLGLAYPQVYNNLGNAEITSGDYADAEKNLQKALQLSPGFGVAKSNLLKLYLVSKQYTKAEAFVKGNPQLMNIVKEFEDRIQ